MSENFDPILTVELEQIDRRRRLHDLADGTNPAADAAEKSETPCSRAHRRQLVGLAFSGGGIRSATFNLGFLQGLANLRLLTIFDYLSTVSGGGYIGSWLTAWIHHKKTDTQLGTDAGIRGVEEALRTGDAGQNKITPEAEPEPIRHLRRHSNYLAPREGLFSIDRWRLFAIYLRNVLLNQLVLLPAAFAVMLLSRAGMLWYYPYAPENQGGLLYDEYRKRAEIDAGWFGVHASLFVVFTICGFFNAFRAVRAARLGRSNSTIPAWTSCRIRWFVVAPLIAASVTFCYIGPYSLRASARLAEWLIQKVPVHISKDLPKGILRGLDSSYADCLLFMIVAMFLVAVSHWLAGDIDPSQSQKWPRIRSCGAGLVWGALLFGVYRFLLFEWFAFGIGSTIENESLVFRQISGTAHLTTFGPPLVLLSIVLMAALGVGFFRNDLPDEIREWWASLSARLLLAAAVWTTVNLVSLYATPLVIWAEPWARTWLGSGWVLTVASGVLAGGSRRTDGTQSRSPYLDLVARVGLHVFAAGVFILVSLLVHKLVDIDPSIDAFDEFGYPYRYEPAIPATKIELDRTGTSENVEIHRKKEYMLVPNEAAAARQKYWLSMMLTGTEPRPQTISIGDDDMEQFRKAGISHEIRAKLNSIRYAVWNRESFARKLSKLIPDRKHANRILELFCKNGVIAPDCDTCIINLDVIKEIEELQQYHKQIRRLPFRNMTFFELHRTIDREIPEAWESHAGQKIMRIASQPGIYFDVVPTQTILKLAEWFVPSIGIFWLFATIVDVNSFSLHGLYRNRLIRAYLGAGRTDIGAVPTRDPDPETDIDPYDDFKLARLDNDKTSYDGPYPIVNVALNMVQPKELAWQERKAAPFILTPLFCGSDRTAYRPAEDFGGGVTLGTGVALSGAAASPNMGYHSSPAITFLLTVFNARLGGWLGNPRADTWKEPSPRGGFFHLLWELFGLTNDDSKYVYLSDGGHFENLGVYELVRRRCQYVVVCDAGQDGDHSFEDLANLIRKVRIDFQIRIELTPDCLHLQKEPRHSRWHCAIGKIRYDDVDPGAMPGTLVYVKPSLTGDEPTDVLQYAASHPTFPHESTANQFYTESQFESYRALGQHIAESVFMTSVSDMQEAVAKEPDGQSPGELHHFRCRALFASVMRHWFALPPQYEAKFVEATKDFVKVQEALRTDPRLRLLTLDLYPELAPGCREVLVADYEDPSQLASRRAAELHILAQMIQALENAYLSLDLEIHYAHPLNRGWIDVFHRWSSAETFRTNWPLLRAEFGREFIRFCEKQMRLGEVVGGIERMADQTARKDLKRLLLEFEDQWLEYADVLRSWLDEVGSNSDTLAWKIWPRNPYPGMQITTGNPVPAGLIVVRPGDEKKDDDDVPIWDLFVWVWGAYRNTGLGRTAIRLVFEELRRRLPLAFRLRVRLPIDRLSGPGGKLQRAMWLTFYEHLEFRRRPQCDDDEVLETRLYRTFE